MRTKRFTRTLLPAPDAPCERCPRNCPRPWQAAVYHRSRHEARHRHHYLCNEHASHVIEQRKIDEAQSK